MFKKEDSCVIVRIGEEVPDEQEHIVMDILDSFVESRKPNEVDSIQVFRLSIVQVDDQRMQQITHCQGYPLSMATATYIVEEPVEATIFAYLVKKEGINDEKLSIYRNKIYN